jgi:hypothetical protein
MQARKSQVYILLIWEVLNCHRGLPRPQCSKLLGNVVGIIYFGY